jgi:hypothetical protein
MTGRFLTDAGRNVLKNWGTVAAISFVAFTVASWIGGTGFVETVNWIGQLAIWLILIVVVGRVVYLPVQFLRHRMALNRELERERRQTGGEAATERVGAHVVSFHHRYPQDVPWWRW